MNCARNSLDNTEFDYHVHIDLQYICPFLFSVFFKNKSLKRFDNESILKMKIRSVELFQIFKSFKLSNMLYVLFENYLTSTKDGFKEKILSILLYMLLFLIFYLSIIA